MIRPSGPALHSANDFKWISGVISFWCLWLAVVDFGDIFNDFNAIRTVCRSESPETFARPIVAFDHIEIVAFLPNHPIWSNYESFQQRYICD